MHIKSAGEAEFGGCAGKMKKNMLQHRESSRESAPKTPSIDKFFGTNLNTMI